MISRGVSESVFCNGISYGQYLDMLTVGQAFGTDKFDEYIDKYGLKKDLIGFEVTESTSYKEVRNIVAINQLDEYTEKMNAQKQEATTAPEVMSPPKEEDENNIIISSSGYQIMNQDNNSNSDENSTNDSKGTATDELPSDDTIVGFARTLKMTPEEFKSQLGVDMSIPNDTNVYTVLAKAKIANVAKVIGHMTYEEYVKTNGWPSDKVNPDMTLGEVAGVINN